MNFGFGSIPLTSKHKSKKHDNQLSRKLTNMEGKLLFIIFLNSNYLYINTISAIK